MSCTYLCERTSSLELSPRTAAVLCWQPVGDSRCLVTFHHTAASVHILECGEENKCVSCSKSGGTAVAVHFLSPCVVQGGGRGVQNEKPLLPACTVLLSWQWCRGRGRALKLKPASSECFLIMRPPAVAARMLSGQFVTLLSGHFVKYMLALCSLVFMALRKSFDLDVSQAYRHLCGLDCAGRGGFFLLLICTTSQVLIFCKEFLLKRLVFVYRKL